MPGTDKAGMVLGIFLGGCLIVFIYWRGLYILPWFLVVSIFLFLLYSLVSHKDVSSSIINVGIWVFGFLYIPFLLSYLVLVRELEDGQWWLFFLFAVIWGNDTFAYYIGGLFGKHKLSPIISPKKTVEGALGGLFGGSGAALLFHYLVFNGISVLSLIILAIFLSIIGQIGDLFESLIKRSVGAKDSGFIIPGHGGILDRIDSVIFSLPILYYYLRWQEGLWLW
jgi:phosphatidate cytidylyltransferase